MRYIAEVQKNGFLWMNITKQAEQPLREMQKRFNFLEQDIAESLPPMQRAKIVKRPSYYFMVLHFPVFNRQTRRLGFTEIDFFLSAHSLVTVHENKLPVVEKFFNECLHEPLVRDKYLQGTAAHILFELLSRLLEAIFPILLHVNTDINDVDHTLFAHVPNRTTAEEILRLKTNIVTFRRTIQGHKTVMERLILYSGRELDVASYQGYINSLREFNNEIWHMLESQNESINALHQTNESLVSLRMNEIMRTLTIISVITFPLTLLATVFTIRAGHTPFVDNPYGFWIIMALLGLGALMMIIVFRRKKWL